MNSPTDNEALQEEVRALVADTTVSWDSSQTSTTIDHMTDKFLELFARYTQAAIDKAKESDGQSVQ